MESPREDDNRAERASSSKRALTAWDDQTDREGEVFTMTRTCETCCHSRRGTPDQEMATSWIGSRKPQARYFVEGRICSKSAHRPHCVFPEETCPLWTRSPAFDLLCFFLLPHVHAWRLRSRAKISLDTWATTRDHDFALRSASGAMWSTLETLWRGRSFASGSLCSPTERVESSPQEETRTARWTRQLAGNVLRQLRGLEKLDPELFRDLGIDDPSHGPEGAA